MSKNYLKYNLNLTQFISEYFYEIARNVYISRDSYCEKGFPIQDCGKYYDEDVLREFEAYELDAETWFNTYID